MTTITTQHENTITNSVAASLVRDKLCTPKQALATAVVFAANLTNLLNDQEEWVFQVSNALDDLEVDGEKLEPYPALDALVRSGYVEYLMDTRVIVAGKRTIKILDEVKQAYAPLEAINGIVSRVRGYSQVKHSELFKEAIHALEGTEYMACGSMLEIARDVYRLANPEQKQALMAEDYVLKGTAGMKPLTAYVSEFFGDRRGRIYQASCFGPNGQSSDMARSMMDLHGVSMDYDDEATIELLLAEMHDMGTFTSEGDMLLDIEAAVKSPAEFIISHMDDTTHIDKPWNFVKFSILFDAIYNEEKPYIGVAVGLDAKCSGPQLGALMVADQAMLAATGFTMKKIDDAYVRCIDSCEKHGITGLTRSLVKKPFMAVFYGASGGAMMNHHTITLKTHQALFSAYGEYVKNEAGVLEFDVNMDMYDAFEEKADLFYTAITNSFGRELNQVRATIKRAGVEYVKDADPIEKFDKPLTHNMPDGFEVAMDYRIKLDIEGNPLAGAKPITNTNIKTGFIDKNFKNMVFSTEDYAFADYARTGFVNMIQASDALLARLIVVHAKRLGAQHIIAIHDCFRVNIHDMAILEDAIRMAYHDLFSAKQNTPTKDLPLGTDILGMYFDGSKEATKPEYKNACGYHSQFFKNGTRLLRAVNGVHFKTLVNALGTTYYFAK